MFTYDLTDLNMVDIETVIVVANFTYNATTNKYQLDENDYKVFNNFFKNADEFIIHFHVM